MHTAANPDLKFVLSLAKGVNSGCKEKEKDDTLSVLSTQIHVYISLIGIHAACSIAFIRIRLRRRRHRRLRNNRAENQPIFSVAWILLPNKHHSAYSMQSPLSLCVCDFWTSVRECSIP